MHENQETVSEEGVGMIFKEKKDINSMNTLNQ